MLQMKQNLLNANAFSNMNVSWPNHKSSNLTKIIEYALSTYPLG